MMKFILDEVFEEAGTHCDAHLKCVKLEPMYRLQFSDKRIEPTTAREAMLQQLDQNFPGSSGGYDNFMAVEGRRFRLMYPCLQKDYATLGQYCSPVFSEGAPEPLARPLALQRPRRLLRRRREAQSVVHVPVEISRHVGVGLPGRVRDLALRRARVRR
jgi:phytoene dehydrogenase-like protein